MDYLSSAGKTYIRFKSNEIVEKSGFKFTASILDGKVQSNYSIKTIQMQFIQFKTICIFILLTACARNYTKPQGRLYAKKSVDCELHINVPENYTITLYFTSLEYHTSTPCTEDNMPLKVGHFLCFVLSKQ